MLKICFNPLNTKLNPICHMLVFLGAHHILHVSRIGVKPIGVYNSKLKAKGEGHLAQLNC
jgi:hypothetical protein